MKTIWRKNFDIRRVDYNLPIETAPGFGGLNFLTVGKNCISKFIWVVKNLNCDGTYFLKHELRELIELSIKKILTDPGHIDKIHKQATKLNWDYFKLAEKIRKLNFSKLTDKELLIWQKKLFNLQYLSHCWSLPTTWYLDSDGEDFSKFMISFLKERIAKLNLNFQAPTVFSILTTPKEESFTSKEEKESLKILDWIKSTPKLKIWFMSQTTEQLAKNFSKLPFIWKNKIIKHHYNYCWIPYTYIGPAYGLDYYLEMWRGLLHENFNPKAKINSIKFQAQKVQKEQNKLVKILQLSPLERHWFKVSADIVWLKGFRKDTFFHGFYVLDLLLKEIGKRGGLSLMQTKYLLPSELPLVLRGEDLSQVANQRQKFSVIYAETPKNKKLSKKSWTEKGITVMTGNKARKFLKKHKFEKITVVQTSELIGTCACPGTAKGIIKIINVPDEMDKMNQGDIMLSHTTFPALVPAMKKASAIITEDGGITCHAAIVARELQTPCVVGCKNAIAILKDGDLVEVDANRGVITKL